MTEEKENITRRDFIKSAGVGGITSLVALSTGLLGRAMAQEKTPTATPKKEEKPKMPLRSFGKTGIKVPILSLGGMFDIPNNQIILKKALDWGVTYWDTANKYEGGNSELGIGKYFEKFPEARKKVFLVTKSGSRDAKGLTELLNRSLERMKTDYLDLYFIHGLKNIEELSPEIKAWAEKAKKENKIKFFGFSTHRNMGNQLFEASKLGWIDGIMMTYNYRIMQNDDMKKGVEACQKAGIGLTAMKTQGGRSRRGESEEDQDMAAHFIKKGYTPHQAKLKAVWENQVIAAICSQMPNLTILSANVAAALDKTKLELSDLNVLKIHAQKTCKGYCAGCSDLCEKALGGDARIADVMRYMMYYRNYGELGRARDHFAALPASVRSKMVKIDYTGAERVCPQGIAIGKIMREAGRILA